MESNNINHLINDLSEKIHSLSISKLHKRRSEHIDQLSAALAKAQAEMAIAGMNNKNPYFKSNYASFTDLVKASRPSLTKYELSVKQEEFVDGDSDFLETILAHSSGQWSSSITRINPPKPDIQAFGSYLSYKKRYAYGSIVGVITGDEDDDGESAMSSSREMKTNGNGNHIETISKEQLEQLEEELKDREDIYITMKKGLNINKLADMPKSTFYGALKRIRDLKNINPGK